MSDAVRAIFADWDLPWGLTLSLAFAAALYLRGWLATASPMAGFADALLTAHMIEHLLLMSAIPMLLLYGLPVVPLLRGLPPPVLHWFAGPLLRAPALRRIARWMLSPPIAWLAMNLAFLGWHIPAAYDFALRHETWHGAEHLCFLFTALLFWGSIYRPWPASERRNDWGAILYLALADVVMTLLSAFLAFCDRPVYPYYTDHPNPFHIPVLDDQVLGAVVMWVLGSFAFLVPAMLLTVRMLSPRRGRRV